MIASDILSAVISESLPPGSSRQVVRRQLFKRAFKSVSEVFNADRRSRRKLSRKISHDLWQRGERLDRD